MVNSRVVGAVEEKLRDRLNRFSLVVWFDPTEQYADVVDHLDLSGNLLKCDGSFLEIRHKIESEDPEFKKRWVIYVPEDKEKSQWLRELWLIGTEIEIPANELLRELDFVIGKKQRRELEGEEDNTEIVNYPTEYLERREYDSEKIVKARIKNALDLDSFDFFLVTAKFLDDPEFVGKRLREKGKVPDFIKLLGERYGVKTESEELSEFQEELIKSLFLGEFVYRSGLGLRKFEKILPKKEGRTKCAHFIRRWQDTKKYEGAFLKAESEFRKKYGEVVEPEHDFEDLSEVSGLKSVDDFILKKIDLNFENGVSEDIEKLYNVIEKRKELFWGQRGSERNGEDWEYLLHAVKCLRLMNKDQPSGGFGEIINHYIEEGWRVDYGFRKAAEIRNSISIVEKARQYLKNEYYQYLRKINDCFSEHFSVTDSSIPLQTKAFENIEEGSAIIIVDALRYELAQDLIGGKEGDKKIEPFLGVFPSITKTGMAAILPDSEGKLSFEKREEDFSVLYDGNVMNSRDERIEKYGSDGLVVYRTLDELLDCEKEKVKSEIESGNRILVFSQEIDLTGESLDAPSLSRFRRNIGDINKVIKTLRKVGVETVYVLTDHGFLYKPKEMASESVAKPSGDIVKFGRRFAVGKDLDSDYLIFGEVEDYGIESDLDFAFPKSLGTFKKRGGSRKYLHGGISLQELVVPVVKITSGGKETEKKVVVKFTEVPEKTASPYFKIGLKLLSSALDVDEKRIRIEPKQYGKQIGDDVYCTVGVSGSTATVKLNLDEVEDQTGELDLHVYDDETEMLIDQKRIRLDLLYEDGEL